MVERFDYSIIATAFLEMLILERRVIRHFMMTDFPILVLTRTHLQKRVEENGLSEATVIPQQPLIDNYPIKSKIHPTFMRAEPRKPFLPSSKSPQFTQSQRKQPKPSRPLSIKPTIPRIDFHDRRLNLQFHGPINHIQVERWSALDVNVIDTLQEFDVSIYPMVDFISLSVNPFQNCMQICIPNKGVTFQDAASAAKEESIKREKELQTKRETLERYRKELKVRLAFQRRKAECQISK
jgi:hypothetical protein